MTTIKRLSLILAVTLCALFITAQAQTPRMATVNISAQTDKVHISAEGEVSEMRVDVADEQGEVVFQSGAISGGALDWNMRNAQGERVAAGTYLVTVTFRTASGKLRKRVEQVVVAEAEKSETQATQTAAPEAVQATITGAGTTGKIAKFTGAATIGNSVITESAGKLNIGLAGTPLSTLTVKTATENYGLLHTNGTVQVGTWAGRDSTGTQGGYFGTKTNHPLGFFAYQSGPVMTIATNGNVGIGTTTPTAGMLHVQSGDGTGVFAKTTGTWAGVWGESSGGGPGVFGYSPGSTGIGVQGSSTNSGTGVKGTTTSTGIGVYGESTSGEGVYGYSSSGYGVFGISSSGYAGYFYGNARVVGNLQVGSCTGCTMTSDQNLKANFSTINPRQVLDRLAVLPLAAWNYKSDDSSIRHVGPMAQDFRAAFNLGADDKHIDMIDANGVTMAAIQGLYQMMREKDRQIEQQSHEIKQQASQIAGLQAEMVRIKRTVQRKRTASK